MRYFIKYLLFPLMLLLGGCAVMLPQSGGLPQHRQMQPIPDENICRVAVLPFLNASDYPLADAIFTKVFAAELAASGGWLLNQEGDVHKVYQQLFLLPGAAPTPEQFKIIADRLDAQLLITGTVIEIRETPAAEGVNTTVAVDVMLRNGKDGEPVWGAYHRRHGVDYRTAMHFGYIQTVTSLSRQVTEEIISLWLNKGIPQCND